MKQTHAYNVDLTRIDGDGEFSCPRCGVAMSPDDESEESYSILGSTANANGLEEMEIRCNKCSSHLHLTGFLLLREVPDLTEEKTSDEKEENVCFVAHV